MNIQQARQLKQGDVVKFFVDSSTCLFNGYKPAKVFTCIVDEVSPKTWKDDRVWDKSRNGQEYCWVVVTEINVIKPKTFTKDSFALYR